MWWLGYSVVRYVGVWQDRCRCRWSVAQRAAQFEQTLDPLIDGLKVARQDSSVLGLVAWAPLFFGNYHELTNLRGPQAERTGVMNEAQPANVGMGKDSVTFS